MAFHVLGTNWWFLIILKDLEFTVLISFCIAIHQRSFPFSLSKVKASSTVLGTLIPKLVCHLMVSFVECCYDSLSFLRHGLSTRRMQVHHLYPLLLHILQPQQGITLSCHSVFPMRLIHPSTLCRVVILL